MAPDVFDVVLGPIYKNAAKPVGMVAEGDGYKLTLDAARAQDVSDGDEIRFQNLLENFEREPPIQFHARRTEQGADGAGGAALLSDHFAEVAGSNA